MTSHSLTPVIQGAVATIYQTPTNCFATVITVNGVYHDPIVLQYNDHNEATGLDSLLAAYQARLESEYSDAYTGVVSMLTNLWGFRNALGDRGFHEARTVGETYVEMVVTNDATKLPDGMPKQPKVMPEGTYEIWVEGHVRSYGAVKLGEAQGATFKEACIYVL